MCDCVMQPAEDVWHTPSYFMAGGCGEGDSSNSLHTAVASSFTRLPPCKQEEEIDDDYCGDTALMPTPAEVVQHFTELDQWGIPRVHTAIVKPVIAPPPSLNWAYTPKPMASTYSSALAFSLKMRSKRSHEEIDELPSPLGRLVINQSPRAAHIARPAVVAPAPDAERVIVQSPSQSPLMFSMKFRSKPAKEDKLPPLPLLEQLLGIAPLPAVRVPPPPLIFADNDGDGPDTPPSPELTTPLCIPEHSQTEVADAVAVVAPCLQPEDPAVASVGDQQQDDATQPDVSAQFQPPAEFPYENVMIVPSSNNEPPQVLLDASAADAATFVQQEEEVVSALIDTSAATTSTQAEVDALEEQLVLAVTVPPTPKKEEPTVQAAAPVVDTAPPCVAFGCNDDQQSPLAAAEEEQFVSVTAGVQQQAQTSAEEKECVDAFNEALAKAGINWIEEIMEWMHRHSLDSAMTVTPKGELALYTDVLGVKGMRMMCDKLLWHLAEATAARQYAEAALAQAHDRKSGNLSKMVVFIEHLKALEKCGVRNLVKRLGKTDGHRVGKEAGKNRVILFVEWAMQHTPHVVNQIPNATGSGLAHFSADLLSNYELDALNNYLRLLIPAYAALFR